jgi:hypothetical protein
MLTDTKKLHIPGKGYKKITENKPKKAKKVESKYFDYSKNKNWLIDYE